MLDATWEDSRTFAATYLKQRFADNDYSPSVLLSLCDSNREEVQQFGRDLVVRSFAAGAGPEVMAKLSEHPSGSMQAFVSGLVAEHARGSAERIAALEPYFAAVLARPNRGRVAKERVLAFFAEQARGDAQIAEVIGRLLAEASATLALTYKAHAIEIMTAISAQHPGIALPLASQPVEARRAV
jgi:hypothetical protein